MAANNTFLLFRIRPLYFLAALLLGLIYVHYTVPPPVAVLKFPSPYNAGLVVYRDKGDACYKYRADVVPCQSQDKVQPQPVIEDYQRRRRGDPLGSEFKRAQAPAPGRTPPLIQ